MAAACSDGSEPQTSSAIEPSAGAAITLDGATASEGEAVEAADDGGADQVAASPVAEPKTIDEFEVAWAAARAEVVTAIRAADYGVNGENVLVGPGGFEVDLDDCPADWDDSQGVSSSTIAIGHTAPRSGNLFAYGFISTGLETYFDYVNDGGGVGGRDLELLIRDDGYDSVMTVEQVEELLATDRPFAVTTFGTPGSLAVREQLNEGCVPQPFVMSNHPAWGDPQNNPWTTGLQLAYSTEAVLWGTWIEENLSDELPVTVGAIVSDSEFGAVYEKSFADWTADHPAVISEFVPVRHDPATSSVDQEVAQAVADSPDVFIAMTNGNPCLFAVQAAGRAALVAADTVLFTSSTCKNPDLYMAPAGSAGDGFHIVGGGWKITSDAEFADDPFVAWANETLAAAGSDTAIGFFGTGFAYYGWAYVEALRIAAELEGGLTRTNFLIAQRALDLDHPALLDGVAFAANGLADGYLVEGSDVSRYDAENERWEQVGDVIDVNGETANCVWNAPDC